ncbi:Protein root UVB sensitive 1, chloroplastic [Porphyridium purpureum]|uniref:Protein root UVB sensitive 1, chloroplastic n=1 Tax=Porphyridium purpureum TaxID=35688 RepID=A0A5J4Z9D4_PORPP|nr:Protein root UVB sensitive 1, chloroplastic [Porphyridium purpureum]|eukprot:POR5433..scf295_1
MDASLAFAAYLPWRRSTQITPLRTGGDVASFVRSPKTGVMMRCQSKYVIGSRGFRRGGSRACIDDGEGGGGGGGSRRGGGRILFDDDNDGDDDGPGEFNARSMLMSVALISEVQGALRTEYVEQADGSLSKTKHRRNNTDWRITEELLLFFLPEGFPDSVGESYLEYSTWRGLQNIISAMTAVLSTHALLTAVGVGSGTAAGVAAATNWVLKDGIGQIGKLITARMGFQFDADPKFWRLFSDILFDAGLSMEILTPLFPNYFLLLAAVGNFTKSVSMTIGMSCRNSVLTTFVKRENLGEISAKNDAQNTITNLTGTGLGIGLANMLPKRPSAHLATFLGLTAIYSFFNYLSMKSVRLQTLNRQRLALALDTWVRAGEIPAPSEVNKYEVIIPFKRKMLVDSPPLHFGVSLNVLCENNAATLKRLRNMYKNEKYMLCLDSKGRIQVALHADAQHSDQLLAMLHVAYIRRKLITKRNAEQCADCAPWTAFFQRQCRLPAGWLQKNISEHERHLFEKQGLEYAKKHLSSVKGKLEDLDYHTKTLLLAPERFRADW